MSAKHDEMCEGVGPAVPKAPAGSLYASLKGARGVLRTPLGLLMGGAALVLALMISLLAFISIERSEAAMGRLLAEKGSSFIIARGFNFKVQHPLFDY